MQNVGRTSAEPMPALCQLRMLTHPESTLKCPHEVLCIADSSRSCVHEKSKLHLLVRITSLN